MIEEEYKKILEEKYKEVAKLMVDIYEKAYVLGLNDNEIKANIFEEIVKETKRRL